MQTLSNKIKAKFSVGLINFAVLVLILEGLVGPHRIDQPQLLQHLWLGHRLGLL